MNVVNDDFINIRAIKRDIEAIKVKSKNAELWQNLQDGFEKVSDAMQTIIPTITKYAGYPAAVLGVIATQSSTTMFANNEPLQELVKSLAVDVGFTALGSYAAMILTTKIYEGLKERSDNKNLNLDVLLERTQRKAVELEIDLAVRPDSNATVAAKDLLKSLHKTLYSKNEDKKLELETEFMFGRKLKINKPKM